MSKGRCNMPLSVKDSIDSTFESISSELDEYTPIANLLPLTGVDVLGPSEVPAPSKKDVSISLSMQLVISTSSAVIAGRVLCES